VKYLNSTEISDATESALKCNANSFHLARMLLAAGAEHRPRRSVAQPPDVGYRENENGTGSSKLIASAGDMADYLGADGANSIVR
jgi:hypothetical protein